LLARTSQIVQFLQFCHNLPLPYSFNSSSRWESLRQRDVADFDVLIAPLVEQLDAANLLGDFLGKNLVAGDGFDFDVLVVRHDGDADLGVVVRDGKSRES